jgi:hypothetical protein
MVTQLWEWCIKYQLDLMAVRVLGTLDILADSLSRTRIDQREWILHNQVIYQVSNMGLPQVDLFTMCHNCKVPVFCSLCLFPGTLAQDTLSITWNSFLLAYGFPPIILMAKVLQNLRVDRTTVILITSQGPIRAW